MLNKFKRISLLFILLIGVLGNVFASAAVDDGAKISAEKRSVGAESIKAWEALFDLPLLRTNVTKLQAVFDFTFAKNIDPSLVKTELNVPFKLQG